MIFVRYIYVRRDGDKLEKDIFYFNDRDNASGNIRLWKKRNSK